MTHVRSVTHVMYVTEVIVGKALGMAALVRRNTRRER